MKRCIGLVIVTVIIATFAFGPAQAQDNSEATSSALQTKIADLNATLTAIAPTPAGTSGVPAEFTFTGKLYGATFHVVVGNLEILKISLYDTLSEERIYPRGKFVAIQFKLTNMGTEPVSFSFWETPLLLRDDKGRAFSPDSDASRALLFKRDFFVWSFQPGLTYDHVLVWDVAKDATGFTLEVEGTNIKIPLT